MAGEPSRLDRLQIRLNLMRRTVRELEEQIERERNPAARHAKPKLRVIKGGLSAWVGPFAVAGAHAREHLAATTAAAATVAVAAAGGVAVITETAPEATAGQVTSSTYAPHDGAAPPGGDFDGSAISAVSPGPDSTPPSASPGPAFTPTPAPTASALAAQEIMPPLEPVEETLFPSLEPLPTPTVTLEPEPTVEPVPLPSPSPTGTEPALPAPTPKNAGQAHVEAVDACLVQKATVKMQDCLAALVS